MIDCKRNKDEISVFQNKRTSAPSLVSLSHLMHGTLHTCIGDHAEDARLKTPVEGRQGLLFVDFLGTRHDTMVCAGLLQIQPHLQHLPQR